MIKLVSELDLMLDSLLVCWLVNSLDLWLDLLLVFVLE